MAKRQPTNDLSARVTGLARVHFLFVAALATQIIIYHAWQLITPEAVLQRWLWTTGLLVVTTVVWYGSKQTNVRGLGAGWLIGALILADITLATFSVYTQRGMASRAVALYALALVTAAALKSRSALFATAILATAAYTTAAVTYFVVNFNEGYKIELYGEVGFYSILFFVLAGLLWAVVRPNPKS